MKMSVSTPILMHRNRVHPTDLFRRLNKLRHEELLCDLTIVIQGQKFKAHKVVMAACSNYFMTAILGGKSSAAVSITDSASGSHMSVELQYVTIRGFAPLLDYAYTSELIVNASDVIDVLAAASYMQMFEVSRACSNFMRTAFQDTVVPEKFAGLQLWSNYRAAVLKEEAKKLDVSEVATSNGVSEQWSSLLQSKTDLKNDQPHYSSAPSLAQTSILPPFPSLPKLESHYPPTAHNINGGTQQLLTHLLHKRSSVPSILPHSSPSPYRRYSKDSVPQIDPEEEKLNTASISVQTEEKIRGNHSSDEQKLSVNENISNCKASPNTREIVVINNSDENATNHEQSTETKLESINHDYFSTNHDAKDEKEICKSNSPENNTKRDTLQKCWQRVCNFNSPKTPEEVPESGGIYHNKEPETRPMIPSLTDKHPSTSFMPQTAFNLHFPTFNNGMSMIPTLHFHQQLLHRHLLAQQQHQNYQAKHIEKTSSELPTMPPNGQYTSVRKRTLHSNVPKPHQCQICGSRFTRYHNLKQHVKLHSGVKPYECDVCRKRFTRNYTLRLHKMKHVGMRNFRCGTCTAAFTSLGEFRAHLRLTMHSHVPAADIANSKRADEDKNHQSFSCSMPKFGTGFENRSLNGVDCEKSKKPMSPQSNNNRQILNGVDSQKRNWQQFPSLFPKDIFTSKSCQDRIADQDLSPLKKRLCGEVELNRHSIHSVDVQATAPSTST